MQKKVYPQSFKDEVVKFYMTNHTIAETIEKYGIAESNFIWGNASTSFICASSGNDVLASLEMMLRVPRKWCCTALIDATIKKSIKSRVFELLSRFQVHP